MAEATPTCANAERAVDTGATDADAGPLLAIGRTRFFGFVAIDCGYDDRLDAEVRTEYVDEVSGFTNVAHVCVSDDPDAELSARLTRLETAGVGAILDVGPVLFESVPGASRADPVRRLALRSDAAARLTRFLAANGAVLDEAHVAAIYLADEPAWNALPMDDLAAAARMLDEETDLPLFFVEAGDALDALVIPPEIDLVGFDR